MNCYYHSKDCQGPVRYAPDFKLWTCDSHFHKLDKSYLPEQRDKATEAAL